MAKRLGMRDWGFGLNASVALTALILLAAISACGGGTQPQEQTTSPPPAAPAPEPPKAPYHVYVTNEIGGDLTVIDGGTNQVVATIPLGKRPRGIKVSPDGTKLFVALSGSPMAPPGTDESKLPPPDRTADGIGVVDIATRKITTVLTSGTDPEQISLSADGSRVFVSNEDAGVASIIDVATNKIVGDVKVGGEPEGVTTSPNGQWVYVTSEEDNRIAVIDTASNKLIKMFEVGARPRSSAFLPDSSKAYVTAENGGTVHVVNTKNHTVTKTLKITGEMARPMGVVASADGRRVYVTTGRGQMLLAIDTAKDE